MSFYRAVRRALKGNCGIKEIVMGRNVVRDFGKNFFDLLFSREKFFLKFSWKNCGKFRKKIGLWLLHAYQNSGILLSPQFLYFFSGIGIPISACLATKWGQVSARTSAARTASFTINGLNCKTTNCRRGKISTTFGGEDKEIFGKLLVFFFHTPEINWGGKRRYIPTLSFWGIGGFHHFLFWSGNCIHPILDHIVRVALECNATEELMFRWKTAGLQVSGRISESVTHSEEFWIPRILGWHTPWRDSWSSIGRVPDGFGR